MSLPPMPSPSWDRVQRILHDLIDADPHNPDAWIDRHPPDDPELRAEVQSLFEAYEHGAMDAEAAAANWLKEPASDHDSSPDSGFDHLTPSGGPLPEPGQTVGRYRLVNEIGAGGMGVVFRAERADGSFEQSVAVKLLHRHIRSADTRQRFEAERQILAGLDHPNIARLVDGGVTRDGRPYLVMEHVDGIPMTDYANQNQLSDAQRVDLLMQVVDAVSAAHQNLIVHRDLKPSNVLVTEQDGTPRVKLLDFGIAKILDEEWPVTAPVTRTGRGLMTPAYAAPEQLSGGDISTATDTYQLGVLAYELVTGTRPFGGSDSSLSQIRQDILHTSPDPPSTRNPAEGVDRRRLTGDLDTIILKALRKEPDRRYRTPEVFRRDLQRYRANEPIEARTATFGYHIKKFVRRNRWGVAAGVLAFILAAVSVGIIIRERNAARRQAEKAEQVSSFLVDLFEASDPNQTPSDSVTVRTLLHRGRDQLKTLEDPAVIGEMAHVLGQTQRRLGKYEKARSLLQEAIRQRTDLYGTEHPETLASLNAFALLERDKGHYAIADTLLERVVAGRQALRGKTDSTVVQSLMYLGFVQRRLGDTDEAETSLRRALEAHRTQTETPNILTAELLFNLAALLRSQSRYEAALPVQRRSFHLVDSLTQGSHPGRIANLNNLAILQQRRGELNRAKRLYIQLLDDGTALYGEDHPKRATWMNNLAGLHTKMFEYERADSLLTQALKLGKRTVGTPHPIVALILHNRAANAYERGDLAAADTLFPEAVVMMQDVHDSPSRKTAQTRRDYAMVDLAQGRLERAENRLRQSLRTLQSVHGNVHPATGDILIRLGRVALAQGMPDMADSLATQAVRHVRSASAPSATDLVRIECLRAEAALTRKQLDRAGARLQQARQHASNLPPHETWRRYEIQMLDGERTLAQGQTTQAETLLRGSVNALESTLGPQHVRTRAARQALRNVADTRVAGDNTDETAE